MSITGPLAASIRGLTYPLTVRNGNLATSADYDLIAQQIRSVIETRFYERVMRADYGIGEYTLEVLDPAQINAAIQTAIRQYVSGLSSLSVVGDWKTAGDDGLYRVIVQYSVDGVPQPPLGFSLSN